MQNKLIIKLKDFLISEGISFLKLFSGIKIVGGLAYLTLITGEEFDELRDYELADTAGHFYSYQITKTIHDESPVEDVVPLQAALMALGYDLGRCGADGIYGENTMDAVNQFQTEHGLPLNDDVDRETYTLIARHLLSNDQARDTVTTQLLDPYQTRQAHDLVAEFTESRGYPWSMLLMPDTELKIIYAAFVNGFDQEAEAGILNGCANYHLMDAFRHADGAYLLTEILDEKRAVNVLDLRELGYYHGPELFYMDALNHRIAADLHHETAGQLKQGVERQDIILPAIEQGRFAIYPFPLVPVDQQLNPALETGTSLDLS